MKPIITITSYIRGNPIWIMVLTMLMVLVQPGLKAQTTHTKRTGSVKGLVKTSDGFPAELVTIGLKGHSKGSTTNDKGEFEIRKIDPGNYTLVISFVGLETREIPIEVRAGEMLSVNDVILSEDAQKLEEIIISDTRDYIVCLGTLLKKCLCATRLPNGQVQLTNLNSLF